MQKETTMDILYRCCLVALCISCAINICLSAPLDQYFSNADTEIEDPQRLQLLKNLRDLLPNLSDMQETDEDKPSYSYGVGQKVGSGLWRVLPKRFRGFRTQTRAGGVALCLWKVCPAAPWLVSKRR